MKTLSINEVEQLNGGDCGTEVAKGALGGFILSGGSFIGAAIGAGLNYYFLC